MTGSAHAMRVFPTLVVYADDVNFRTLSRENRFDIYVKIQDKLILELFLDSNHAICTDVELLCVKADFYS